MFRKTAAPPIDPGLQQIDDLEALIVRARDESWAFNAVSPEEIARVRPGVVAQAKAVCDQLRAEYRARSQR